MPAGFRLATIVGLLPVLLTLSILAARAQVTPTPVSQRYGSDRSGYAGEFTDVFAQLDHFWLDTFQRAAMSYRAPGVIAITDSIVTGCGTASPSDFAFYCSPEQTVYYSPSGFTAHHPLWRLRADCRHSPRMGPSRANPA